MAPQPKITSRTLLLFAGIAVVVVAALPAWKQLQVYTSLQPVRAALREGDLETALALLEDLEHSKVQPVEVAYLSGVTNRRLGRLQRAFTDLQRAEDLGWPLEDLTRQRYMTRFQAGGIDGTREYLQGLLLVDTDDATAEEIYEALAKGFLSEFRIGDAVMVLDHWLEWRPKAYQALEWRAQLYDQDQDWKESVRCYREIVNINPDNLSARLHLADALIEDHHVKEAQAEYAEALRRFPDDALARFGLAVCARRLGDSDAAIKWLEEMLASDPNPRLEAEVLFELGQIAMESSEFQVAAKHFIKALQLNPHSSLTHHSLGRTYGILGKTEKSLKHSKRSEELVDIQRRMDKAIEEARAAPKNVEARFEVAQLVLLQDNKEDAISWLRTVLHIDPQHAEARALLAKILQSQGTPESASSADTATE